MGKFRQLSPELWPLIDVKNSFPLSISMSESPSDRPTEHVSVTFCFLNILKNH